MIKNISSLLAFVTTLLVCFFIELVYALDTLRNVFYAFRIPGMVCIHYIVYILYCFYRIYMVETAL